MTKHLLLAAIAALVVVGLLLARGEPRGGEHHVESPPEAGAAPELVPAEFPDELPAEPVRVAARPRVLRLRSGDGRPWPHQTLQVFQTNITLETDAEGTVRLPPERGGQELLVWKGRGDTVVSLGRVDLGRSLSEVSLPEGRALAVRVTNEGAQPVERAHVVLRRPTADSAHAPIGGFAMGHTDTAGLVRFDYLPVAEFRLTVDADGYAVAESALREDRADEIPVVLKRAQGLRVRLVGLEATSDVELAWVLLRDGGGLVQEGAAHLDEDRAFALDRPAPGAYALVLHATSQTPRVRHEFVVGVPAPEELLVEIPPGARLSGRLLDAEGEPVAGTLTIAAAAPATAEGGEFAFPYVPVGAHDVWLDEGATRIRLGHVKIDSGENPPVSLRYPGERSVVLRLPALPGGAQATLRELGDGRPLVAHAHRRPDGTLRFAHVSSGAYLLQIQVRADGPAPRRVWVGREDVDLGLLEVRAQPAYAVKLIGMDWPGLGHRMRATAKAPDADAVAVRLRVRVDADGREWLEGVPPGRYDVTIAVPGRETLTRSVDLQVDAAPIEFSLTER